MTDQIPQANQDAEILVVEDSPTQAERLKHTLEERGYSVTVTTNGRQALAAAKARRPTLIISDIVMPEMDGYELCRQIKSDPALARVPVILLTTLSDPQDVIRGLECRADNFLTKPYDEHYLLSRVEFVLLNQRLGGQDTVGVGVEIHFEGNKHFITASRLQILNLLLSTYEAAIQKNQELVKLQDDLRQLNEHLEDIVEQRTAALMTELAERKRAEQALRDSEEQLRQAQKLEAIGQLAGGVAHDFNNLLTVITGYSDILIQSIRESDPNLPRVEEIKKAAERAASLTRQLLAFSRKQVLQPRVFDLNTLVADMGKMLRRLIGEDIELATALTEDPVQVNADPGQIEQVLMNLVVNARDALPQGGKITIETAPVEIDHAYAGMHVAVRPGPYIMLAVSDNGSGMDEETRKHIFEPFFTTKEQGKGTGLGLSTVYGIVKQSEGNIWVYSEPGQGTTFKVYLPQVAAAAPEPEAVVAEAPMPSGLETILVVEDEDVVRGLVRHILQDAGYKVLDAGRGEDAIRLCAEDGQAIDLLLTDLVMPEMTGREVAGRSSELRPGLKVLFMSGYTDDAIVHHGALEANVDFIQKPFTPADLARKVRKVLDSNQEHPKSRWSLGGCSDVRQRAH